MSVDTRVSLLPVLWVRLVSLCTKFPRRLFWVMKIWQIHNLPFKNMFTLHLKFFRSTFLNIRDEKSKVKKQCLYKAPMGFEPMTSCLLDRRSNQLSYGASRFTVCARFTHHRSRSETLRTPELPLKMDIGISYSNISESPRNILISLFSSCLESCE